jgi:hypothetical protein
VSSELQVGLNGDRLHAIEAPESFVSEGGFAVVLDNQGEAVHVHLHLDDDLSAAAELEGNNHYVDREGRRVVPVAVSRLDGDVRGRLKVVTGYGAETAYVDVTLEPGAGSKPPVEVDEDLAKPPRAESPPTARERVAAALPAGDSLPVLGLGLAAVVVALAVAVTVDDVVVTLGAGVVVGGVVAALVLSLR